MNLLGLGMGTLPAAVIGALATAYCEMKRFALMHYNAEPATANAASWRFLEWSIFDDIASACPDFRRPQ